MGHRLVQTIFAVLLCLAHGCAHVDEHGARVPSHPLPSVTPEMPPDGTHSPVAEIRPTSYELQSPESGFGNSASGPATQPLTLLSLERLALTRHPELGVSAARIDAFRGAHRQAGLYPNPHAGYHATEVGNLGTAGQQGGFVGQRFITGGKLELDQAVAARQIEQSNRELDTAAQRLLNDVRVRFHEVLIAQRRIELMTELVRVVSESVDASRRLFDGKLVGRNELLQAQIRLDSSEIQLESAHNDHVASWRRLAAAVGDSELQPTGLEGELEADLHEYEFDERLAVVLSASPELAAEEAQVHVAESKLLRASREWIPDIDVSTSIRYHNITKSDVVNIQAGMPIPIFDRNEGNVDRAQADVVAARWAVERIRLQLMDRVASEFRRYADARVAYQRYRDGIVPQATESLKLTQQAYAAKQVGDVELLKAHETYIRMHLAQLDALRDMRISQVALEGLVVGQ